MPLTSKGEEILHAMQKQYGQKKGESVFYASRNAGKITGVDSSPLSPQMEELIECVSEMRGAVDALMEHFGLV